MQGLVEQAQNRGQGEHPVPYYEFAKVQVGAGLRGFSVPERRDFVCQKGQQHEGKRHGHQGIVRALYGAEPERHRDNESDDRVEGEDEFRDPCRYGQLGLYGFFIVITIVDSTCRHDLTWFPFYFFCIYNN